MWNAGLQARVETQEADEDEEGMSEPAEVADFLNELGESDNRWTCCHYLINKNHINHINGNDDDDNNYNDDNNSS